MQSLKQSDSMVDGSFRDPSGFVFKRNNTYLRQVNDTYRQSYDLLMESGLYQKLVDSNLLIKHEEIEEAPVAPHCYKIIKPQQLDFISYPYEWSFSALKQAALLTLKIQHIALEHNCSLKDASSYNIQFIGSNPVFIDTLSFEPYRSGEPWIAYRQFCQHFLAPLALMSRVDIRLNHLLKTYIDGIPLDLAAKLLPRRSHFIMGLLLHVHLHAGTQHKFKDTTKTPQRSLPIPKHNLIGLIDNLASSVKSLHWKLPKTQWGNYYHDTNYTDKAFEHKKNIITQFLIASKPARVWDIGANTGVFSRLASQSGIRTVSFDIDPAAVEKNYLEAQACNDTHITPLLLDVTNPSPGIGWANTERTALVKRADADTIMALALIHHLAIGNNLPLTLCAKFFASLGKNLIIEFVPKSDSQVKRLLATRQDIFIDYTTSDFEAAFGEYFRLTERCLIYESERILYLFSRIDEC